MTEQMGASKWANCKPILNSMDGAHACFRGIKRPVGDDDRGYDIYAFVTKPRIMFKYAPSMACVVEPVEIPDDLVCVIYVRMDHPYGRRVARDATAPISRGVVTHWELVEADESGQLPIDCQTRYRIQVW